MLLASLMGLLLAVPGALPDGPRIEAYLDKDPVEVGTRVRLIVEVIGEEAADCDLGRIPRAAGIKVLGVKGPVISMRPSTGENKLKFDTEMVARFEVTLLPTAEGLVTIQPLTVMAQGGKRFLTPSLDLEVIERERREDVAILEVTPRKRHVYHHELVKIRIELFIPSEWSGLIDRHSDSELLSLPWLEGEPSLLFQDLPKPKAEEAIRSVKVYETFSNIPFALDSAQKNGKAMRRLKAEVSYLATKPGIVELPPSEYSVEIPGEKPLFSRSAGFALTILPLPTAGRPEGAGNGVGNFKVGFEAMPQKVRVGETIRLTFTIEGRGNLPFLDLPTFPELGKYFHIYGVTDGKEKTRRWRIFDISPLSTRVKEIPALAFSHFDPEEERYVTKAWGPLKLFVEPGEIKAIGPPPEKELEIMQEDVTAIRIDWNEGDKAGKLRAYALGALGFSALAALSAYVVALRRRWIRVREASVQSREALQHLRDTLKSMSSMEGSLEEGGAASLDLLAHSFSDYIARRFAFSQAEVMAGSLKKLLGRRGVSETLADDAEHFTRRMDAERFKGDEGGVLLMEFVREAETLGERLEEEA